MIKNSNWRQELAPHSFHLKRKVIDGVRLLYLDAWRGEVGYFELDLNRRFAFRFLADNTGETEVCPHQVFFTALWNGMSKLAGH